MMQTPYAQLLGMKRWADHDLYGVVSRNLDRLSDEDTDLMLRILDHMSVVDRIFQRHLQGQPHSFQTPRSETVPYLRELKGRIEEVDDWYLSYVTNLEGRDFEQEVRFAFTNGQRVTMCRGDILLHVCLHGAHHRGNAS